MTEEQFNILTRPLHTRMYASALTLLRDEDAAADCVQDTLLHLWELRGRLDEIEKPEAYCLTAVRRTALDALRRKGRMPVSAVDVAEIDLPGATDPHAETVAREDLRLVGKLLDELAPRQRTVVEMSAIRGLDNAEICEATGISDENVRVLLSRGKSRLRSLFRLHSSK
ncbi:MAG: sigma-70 family RNA polymerase sigma factor [Muribaculaceae bacterium]|nr:sigma-70 family RNA polymerase sigma factor [Muribaculaceae bacterium]